MKKAVLIIIVFVLGLLIRKVLTDIQKKEYSKEHTKQLPDFVFYKNGSAFNVDSLSPDKATIFVYFNTDCEHCRYEIAEVENKAESFKDKNVLFISSERSDKLKQFETKYQIAHYPFIQVLKDSSGNFYKIFSTRMIPSVFIYNNRNEFSGNFLGEVKMDAILNSLDESKR